VKVQRHRPRRALGRALVPAAFAGLLVALPATAAASTNPWFEAPPLNIAHQGGEDQFPSNTMYASEKAIAAGADMLELDVGVTKDDKLVVIHDTTLDRTTNGRGTIESKTLKQIRRLDAAHWFSPEGPDHYEHGRPRKDYPFRGIATGDRKPPKGFDAADFRVPTLKGVLKEFPRTPINIEIKGRTPDEETPEYVQNAETLARELEGVDRPNRLIVASFRQAAVDRFHELLPQIGLSPGIDGAANYLLGGGSPGEGVVAFQVPITFDLNGQVLEVTTRDNVARAHADGYAWHNWFSSMDSDSPPTWRTMVDYCVDGIMTSRPRKLEKTLQSYTAAQPCTHASG
jgi:glycerophosphoryl diester phosphodiesterase